MSGSGGDGALHRGRLGFWSLVTLAAVAVFLLFLIYPLARLFIAGASGGRGGEGGLLEMYVTIFTKRYYYATILNSLYVSLLASALAAALGLPLGYMVARFNIPGKLLIRAAIVLTFVSPPFIGAYAWILLLGRNGVLTGWLAALGIHVPSIYGFGGLVLVMTLQTLPFVFLMVGAGLKTIDQSVEDAAISLGRRPAAVALMVLMPLIVPAASTGVLLVFVNAFSDFGTPMIIGGNYRVLATLIYTEFNSEHGSNPVVASSLSVVLLAVTVGALFLQRWWARRHSHGQETVRPLVGIALGGWKRAAACAYVYLVVLACALPLLTIVVSSFLKTQGPLLTREFTLAGYLNAPRLAQSLTNTITYSVVSTVLCLIAGALVAYVIVRRRDPLARLVDTLSMVPFAVAGVVIGVATSVAFAGPPLYLGGTATILIMVYFIRRLPYSIRSISGMLSQIGTQTEEASISLGVPPGRTFWRITVPMLSPAILAGAVLTFATVAREFNSTVMLYSGATRTIPVEVFAQVLQGNFGAASVVGTVLLVVSAVPIALLFWLMGKDDEILV